jgi:hypothetical protein
MRLATLLLLTCWSAAGACPPGQVYDEALHECIDDFPDCGAGQVWDQNLNICRPWCSGGAPWSPATGECVQPPPPPLAPLWI